MSAHMKKHLTNSKTATQMLYIVDDDVYYAIPKKVAKLYIVKLKKTVHRKGNIPAKELFAAHDKKHGKAAALLQGLRARENLTQVEFAKKIHVTQANLSKMENGSRPTGEVIAKRIAKAFSIDYRYFLNPKKD